MPNLYLRRKTAIGVSSVIILFAALLYIGNGIFVFLESDKPSKSIGSPASGELINGKRLPTKGKNFVAYSYLGSLLGRNSVNDKVRDTVVQTYEAAYSKRPDRTFVYGETGWPSGGRFRPHRSHQNGMSVDFMVPIVDKGGRSVPLPASVFNKFGYDMEFDKSGKSGDYTIDFDAMSMHLYELRKAAVKHGLAIDRVIFAPELQPFLFKTEYGLSVKDTVRFSSRPSWVRHDEHYHVDFIVKDTVNDTE